MQMCIKSLQMCTKEKLLKRLEYIALVPGIFITGLSLRILMDLFHDLGSVKYIKSGDSTELIEKKSIYIQFVLLPPQKQSMFKHFFEVLKGGLKVTN